MDEELNLYFLQRETLLASDVADVGQLKRHDRKLLAAMDEGAWVSPLLQRQGADQDLLQALAEDFDRAVLIIEARARLWPGELGRTQSLLLAEDLISPAWWLSAHYPKLNCPSVFPDEWQDQVWAARALWRRDREMLLPEPWLGWVQVVAGEGNLLETAKVLWQASNSLDWEYWLAPMLTIASHDKAVALINWLASRVEDKAVVELMGLSCQSRFSPWLVSMRNNEQLKEAALREVRWLRGEQNKHHPGRQCWGEPLKPEIWPRLFQSMPLAYRSRLWHYCGASTEGAATSLQGGLWCAGSSPG